MRLTVAILVLGLLLAVGPACSLVMPPPTPTSSAPQPSPTLLPPPKPITSPDTAGSPAAASPTPIPPPGAAASPTPAAPERVRVANTGGTGANMRTEPATTAALVRSLRDGTELDVIGPDRDADGRRWRNVRDRTDNSTSGWVVAEFLETVPVEPPPAPAPAAKPTSAPAVAPPAVASPAPPAAPAGAPSPAASPGAVAPGGGQAGPTQRIGDADRAYLSALQPQVDAIGNAIAAANEQIERAGGRPDILNDPAWRRDTEAVAQSLSDAAAKIRAATPGPNTGEVQRHALNAADRANAAAAALTSTLQSGDARNLTAVRTELVRVLAEINNMNLSLLNLQ